MIGKPFTGRAAGALLVFLLSGPSSACAPDDPGQDEELVPCETFWQPEDGADYGEPWDLPELADLPEVKLDLPEGVLPSVENVTPSTLDLEDVEDWEFEPSSAMFFRRVTDAEIEERGWQEDDVLIIAPSFVDSLRGDAKRVSISLPFFERRAVEPDAAPRFARLEFAYAGEFRPVLAIDRRPEQPKKRGHTLAYYGPPSLSAGTHSVVDGEVLARLASDHDEALHVRGVGLGRRFILRGPILLRDLTHPPPLREPVYLLSVEFDPVEALSFSIMPPSPNAADTLPMRSLWPPDKAIRLGISRPRVLHFRTGSTRS